MAQRHNTDPEESLVPVLLRPRSEDLVNGGAVTFEWEPVPEARAQRLQVAASPEFDELLIDQEVAGESRVTIERSFPTEGDTFYWRVLITDARGTTHGQDHVESFIASPEAVEGDTRHTGHEEAYGPVGELLEGVATEAAAEVTGDDALFRKEQEMGVAHEGIASGQILGLTLAIVLAIALIVVTLLQLTELTAQEIRYSVVGISGYPQRMELEEEAEQRLSTYGVVDEETGVYRIPIDRAMELMIQEAGGSGAGILGPEAQTLPQGPGPAGTVPDLGAPGADLGAPGAGAVPPESQ